MRARAVLAAIALAGVGVRCAIVTGGTGGYVLQEAGTVEAGEGAAGQPECGPSRSDAGTWMPPAGTCRKAADCGDAGQICCLTVPGADLAQATTMCQAGPCPAPGAQLCGKSAECSDTCCVLQQCTAGGATALLKACGVLAPFCTAN